MRTERRPNPYMENDKKEQNERRPSQAQTQIERGKTQNQPSPNQGRTKRPEAKAKAKPTTRNPEDQTGAEGEKLKSAVCPKDPWIGRRHYTGPHLRQPYYIANWVNGYEQSIPLSLTNLPIGRVICPSASVGQLCCLSIRSYLRCPSSVVIGHGLVLSIWPDMSSWNCLCPYRSQTCAGVLWSLCRCVVEDGAGGQSRCRSLYPVSSCLSNERKNCLCLDRTEEIHGIIN